MMAQSQPQLKWFHQVGYGLLEWGNSSVEFLIQVYILVHFVNKEGVAPALAGLIIGAMLIWDALSDPLIGYLSDRTQTRFGRRRPWFLCGSWLLGLGLWFLFLGRWGIFENPALRLGVGLALVNTALTMTSVPHLALAGDMASTRKQKEILFGWRFLFTNLGLISAVLIPLLIGFSKSISSISVCIFLFGLLSFISMRSFDSTTLEAKGPITGVKDQFASIVKNTPFLWLVLAFSAGSIGRAINSSVALFYYAIYLNLEEATVFKVILLPFTLVIGPAILFWLKVSSIYGQKKPAFWAILALGLGTSIVYPLFQAGSLSGPLIFGIVGGILVASIFLFDAMVADLAKRHQDSSTGTQEGMYFGIWKLASKLARALGLAMAGWLLGNFGVKDGVAIDPETGWKIALLFGPGVGVFFIIAAFLLRMVKLNNELRAEPYSAK